MKYSGPLGIPRLTGVGPLVSQESEDGQLGAVPIPEDDEGEDEFISRCMESEWAEEYADGIIEAYDMPDSEEARDRIKQKACVGLLDNEIPEPQGTATSLDF